MVRYLIISIPVIIVVLGTFIYLKRRKGKRTDKSPYIDALHLLLEGKNDEAFINLKRTVRRDTGNIMAYIKLADLFREKGFPIRAAKIHRNLLVRGDLTETEIQTILQHLVLDYQATGQLEKAIEMGERLVQRSKKNVENQRLLLSLCEAKGDWDKAFFFRQSINKWLKKEDQEILALYKVQSGLSYTQQGAEREGRIRFREAIKLDKKCVPAYLYWGDSYRREGRNEDAYRIWRELTLKNPEWAHLSFDRLREVLFDLKRYGEIGGIYQQIIQNKPRIPYVYLNLAELYKKQGNLERAAEVCRKIVDTHPELLPARYLLTQILQQKGEEKQALDEAQQGLKRETEKELEYTCSRCGSESKEPLWHCPECAEWNSFLTEKKQ